MLKCRQKIDAILVLLLRETHVPITPSFLGGCALLFLGGWDVRGVGAPLYFRRAGVRGAGAPL